MRARFGEALWRLRHADESSDPEVFESFTMNMPIASPTNHQVAETSVNTGSTVVNFSHDAIQYAILLFLIFVVVFGILFWIVKSMFKWTRGLTQDVATLRTAVAELRATHSNLTTV